MIIFRDDQQGEDDVLQLLKFDHRSEQAPHYRYNDKQLPSAHFPIYSFNC